MKSLAQAGHSPRALSRHAPPAESLREADAVIHLAGEPVAQRWTAEAKRRIRESRVDGDAQPGGGAGRASAETGSSDLRLGHRVLRLARR